MAERTYPTYTVAEITEQISRRLKEFGPFVLSGEISGWKRYPSGHAYFTLKDETAQISGVMFATDLNRTLGKIGNVLKDGAKVELFGSVGVYANRGNYQFIARSARLVGLGDLMRQYLELKEKLAAEGLFDRSRKRPLPALPRRIGIVSSEAGAVIHDVCTVLTRRFPSLEIRLYPCLVQGAEAPATIRAGLDYFNALADWKADVLIVARGGGSFEDLFCFNDETLVRTVAASRIPVISAVGHETDVTLCDHAADVRAGTPSIAAEIVVPVKVELQMRIETVRTRMVTALAGRGEWYAQRIDQLSDALGAALQRSLAQVEKRLAGMEPRLLPAVKMRFERERAALEKMAAKLEVISPYAVLKRGYSLTTSSDGRVVQDASTLSEGATVTTRLAKGSFTAKVCATVQ